MFMCLFCLFCLFCFFIFFIFCLFCLFCLYFLYTSCGQRREVSGREAKTKYMCTHVDGTRVRMIVFVSFYLLI